MKKSIVRLCAALVAVVAVFSMAACGQEKKLEEAYCTDVSTSIEALGQKGEALNSAITAFLANVNDDTRASVLAAITDLDTLYAEIRDLNPPEKYTNVQKSLTEGVELALQATEIYKKEFTEVTNDTFNDAFVKRVQEGDDLMKQANAKLLEGSQQCVVSSPPENFNSANGVSEESTAA